MTTHPQDPAVILMPSALGWPRSTCPDRRCRRRSTRPAHCCPAACNRLRVGSPKALAAIHGSGLIHRDLKPSNIVLTDNGPRVIDFGIARALEEASLTVTGLVVGTPGHLSPEQITGGAIGPAS